MGNKPYAIPKHYYTDTRNRCCSNLYNKFGLSPYETYMLDHLFTNFTGGERRMHYAQFRKLYKRLNSELKNNDINMWAPVAFCAADTNKDGTLSFDEFVDAYTCFKATPDFKRVYNSGLFVILEN